MRRPITAATATFLARGADHGELALESRGLARAARLVHRRARRVGAWSGRASAAAIRATDLCTRALAADDRERVVGDARHATAATGWAISARAARPLLDETLRRIDHEVSAGVTTHHQSRGRAMTVVAYVLLVVDAVALFTVFGLLLNIDWTAPAAVPLVTAAAFALFGAGVQAKLAVELGRRVWAWRASAAPRDDDVDEFPPRGAVVGLCAVALFGVSVLAALSILLRVRYEGVLAEQVGVATVIGLALAGCALAAPWIIVAHEAFDGSPLTRLAGALTRVVTAARAERERALARADRAIARARALDDRARRERARLRLRVGRCYLPAHRVILLARDLARAAVPSQPPDTEPPSSALPIRLPVDEAALTVALAQSGTAIAEARAARTAVTSTLSPPAERIGTPVHPDW
ncbi:hypothetical protein Acsp05_60500 [Actinokineospora sp. NBRC 105648]|nr:hypothetical protein Acsp05_60500 [Actinokineospora sp. NBRC 105648]